MPHIRTLSAISLFLSAIATTPSVAWQADSSDIIAVYDFSGTSGDVVRDRSDVGNPMNLRIEDLDKVERSNGALRIRGATKIVSPQKASKLIEAVRKTQAITVELWLQPSDTKQKGPARILTLSKNTNERNLTIGQDGSKYDVRFRTERGSTNGLPSVATPAGTVKTKRTHLAFTRQPDGAARIFVNGKQVVEKTLPGGTSNWDQNLQLTIGNERTNDRPWLGTLHQIMIFSRVLSGREISARFANGGHTETPTPLTIASKKAQAGNHLFETKIAPLLSKHCLECHDASNRNGGLDLSRKALAFSGGENGKPIVPGDLEGSLLWESIEYDEMPHDRPPLSEQEKNLVKNWISQGAAWSLDVIDPAIYVLGDRKDTVFVQRLTVPEYTATVLATFGVDIKQQAKDLLPSDVRADGFSNTAYNLNVGLRHINAYSELASAIVQKIDIAKFARRFSGTRRLTDEHALALIRKMGRWILRGPLTAEEAAIYRGISTTVMAEGGDFDAAVAYVIEAMLQSPRFLYRIEDQGNGGFPSPVDDYELASRLSYIIWGASPDKELAAAADAGFDPATMEQQIDRMLRDRRTIEQSEQFVIDWLDLERLANMQPNAKHFPNWTASLAEDMKAETLAFFREVAWKQDRPLSHLLNAQTTFLTPELARHYGIDSIADRLDRYDVSKNPARGGLLTQASVLTVGGDEASMVSRGLFVMQNLLRGVVKDPPPCVDTTPVPTSEGVTQRRIAEARIANSSCGGCHSKFEPLAFGLERYNGIGAFADKDEHGNALREDGDILFPGAESPIQYDSASRLMDLLATSDRVSESITWKVTQFALGRPLLAKDASEVANIHTAAQQAGGTYRNLIKAIAMSQLVRLTSNSVD